jgi:hypothetical protein
MTRLLRCHADLYEIVIAVILDNLCYVIMEDICFVLNDLNFFRARSEQAERNGGVCVFLTPVNSTLTTS